MLAYTETLNTVLAREHLDAHTMSSAVGSLIEGHWTPGQAGGFLTALAGKGETFTELVGAARALRERCIPVPHDLPLVIDVCGTGGDRAGTFNISTCAAFVVAACGVPVAKHGNRAASSRCGSADVLEALGVPIDASPEAAARALQTNHFAFLFAPLYHPAMKAVAPLRKELGVRTIFNITGPLVNPARASRQIIGVARDEHVEPVARALQSLGIEEGAVFHARCGLDEISGEAPTTIYRFGKSGVRRYEIDPLQFGIAAPRSALAGGDAAANAAAMLAILQGERSPRSDVVALNAALALEVAGRAASLADGLALARAALKNGSAYAVFERARTRGAQ